MSSDRWAKRVDEFSGEEKPEFPIETFRHYYVTPVGGFSKELEPGAIGINAQALERNTDIEPYEDLVTVSKIEGARRIPLVIRALFYIVPLTSHTGDALRKSPRGEAVLAPIEDAVPERKALEIATGDNIVINSVMASFGNTRSNVWGGSSP